MAAVLVDTGANGTPAPYGRACTNCAKAKCRCIYHADTLSCERCHRLSKECVPSVTVRKRSAKRQAGSRTAQLEEKLEDLVSLLRAQQSPSTTKLSPGTKLGEDAAATTPNYAATAGVPTPAQSDGGSVHGPVTDVDAAPSSMLTPEKSFADSASTPESPPIWSVPDEPTLVEAEHALNHFRTEMITFFPFVYIPPQTTAVRLRAERPYFWESIMCVATPNSTRLITLGEHLRRIWAQKLVVESEKSLDLLLSLMVYMVWTHLHKKDKPFLSQMSLLAMSIVYDLSLHKLPTETPSAICFRSVGAPNPFLTTAKEQTTEEKRIVLGAFCITSMLSHFLKRMDGLRWTPRMNEALESLAAKPEWIGDELLVTHVRMQLVVDQVDRAPWAPDPAAPIYFAAALRNRLETIKNNVPESLRNNMSVICLYYHAVLIVNESAIPPEPAHLSNEPDFRRHELYQACLEPIKAWWEIFLAMPITNYSGMPFTDYAQMAHALISLHRLTMLDDPAWDRRAARQQLDLFKLLDRLVATFEDMVREGTSGNESNGETMARMQKYWKGAKLFNNLRTSFELDMRAAGLPVYLDEEEDEAARKGADETAATATGTAAENNKGPGFVDGVTSGPLAVPMDFTGGDSWLTDIFNVSWE